MLSYLFYRHAERSDAAANVVVAIGRQRADGAARRGRRARGAHARRRPAARRHGGAALRPPPRVQGATLPAAAAALRIPAEEPPSVPLRISAAPATASAAALPASQGSSLILTLH